MNARPNVWLLAASFAVLASVSVSHTQQALLGGVDGLPLPWTS